MDKLRLQSVLNNIMILLHNNILEIFNQNFTQNTNYLDTDLSINEKTLDDETTIHF